MLPLAAALSILALAGLAAGAHGNWPDWTLFVCAAAAGVMPSMPAMVRARWSALYRDQPLLRTAFALESVLDEVTLIVGPPLAVGLSVAWFPQAGPLAAAALLAVGITAFSLQTRTAPPLNPARAGREPTVLRVAALRKLTFMLAAMGVIVGVIDVMSVAVAASGRAGGRQHRAVRVCAGFLPGRTGVRRDAPVHAPCRACWPSPAR